MPRRKRIATVLVLHELKKLKESEEEEARKNIKPNRKHGINSRLQARTDQDLEAHLLHDISWEDDEKDFQKLTSIHIEQFEHLLSLVEARLKRSDTCPRLNLKPRLKLAITLKFLGNGCSYRFLQELTRVSSSAIRLIVPNVLSAIHETLMPDFLQTPSTELKWLETVNSFKKLWQFPHTLGAVGGKHIRIQPPALTESEFCNCKGFPTIALVALLDAHSRFTFIDIGRSGEATDSTIFENCLHKALRDGSLHIPNKAVLIPDIELSYFLIADDAFELDEFVMKPYNDHFELTLPQEAFNYRLERARTVVDLAFGKLAHRFKVLCTPLALLKSTTDLMVTTCCVLHNYLTKPLATALPPDYKMEKSLPDTFYPLGPQHYQPVGTRNHAERIRDELSLYCITEGNVDFQWEQFS